MKINKSNSVNFLDLIGDKLNVVIAYYKTEDGYKGFVPGLKLTVKDTDFKQCQIKLQKATANQIESMLKQNIALPFFPLESEVKEDFDPYFMQTLSFNVAPFKK